MVLVLGYTGLRVGGRLGFGWCCGELSPGAGVPLRPDSVLLPLQQLVVNKEETTIACRRTCKGKSEGGDEQQRAAEEARESSPQASLPLWGCFLCLSSRYLVLGSSPEF